MKQFTFLLILTFFGFDLASAQFPNADANKTEGTNYEHRPNTIIRTDNDTLVVKRAGTGTQPIILIPGHLQDEHVYNTFIERNNKFGSFYIAIPPGMGGTPAYNWPGNSEDFISRPWSNAFEDELIEYIRKNNLEKPLLIVNWYAGMGMALHIADKVPDLLGGILIVGPARRAPFYRWYRPGNNENEPLFDAEKQRQTINRIIEFWRNVDEFTWHSNMFSASFFTNDPVLGLKTVYEESKHSVPIGIRYFVEYVIDDLRDEISNLKVPVQVVSTMPSLNSLSERYKGTQKENYKANREATLRDWSSEEKENINVAFIEDSGLFAWHDKPEQFDSIFLAFLKSIY